MTLAKARRIEARHQRLLVVLANMNLLNPFPGKSKPVSRRTARLWRGATITFK